MFRQLKIAAISFTPKKFDLASNANRLERYFRMAAKRGAQLALAPEAILDGYPVTDVQKGIIPAACMRDAAITVRDPLIVRFKDLARRLNMCIAFGFAESVRQEIYNCTIFIDHRGRLRGKYHKMQLAEGHDPDQWYNRMGEHSRAFDTPFGRCGFMICNDRWNADLARIAVLDGARYILIPSYGSKSAAQDQAVVAIARQNGVAVLEANVGLLLAVSKGEIVKRVKKNTAIMVTTIDIPAAPSEKNRDVQEKQFVAWRKTEMPKRYRRRLTDPGYACRTHRPAMQIGRT